MPRTLEDALGSLRLLERSSRAPLAFSGLRTGVGELNTADVTLISHTHGRQRRVERAIDKSELQAAVKHGAFCV